MAKKMAQERQDGVLDDLISMYDHAEQADKKENGGGGKKGKLGELLKTKKGEGSCRRNSDDGFVSVPINFHHKW